MKKIILIISSLLLLTGCDSSNKIIMDHSGILEDEDYLQYVSMQNQGKLNEEGIYLFPDQEQSSDQDQAEGQIHMNFTRNIYFQIQYFKDKEQEKPLSLKNCSLQPGDKIYYSKPLVVNANPNIYGFDHFRVELYNENGVISEQIDCPVDQQGFLYQIPEDYTGKKITVYPFGKYMESKLHMNAYLSVDDENPILKGQWSVDNVPVENGEFTVPSFSKYTVKYNYNNDKYRFVSSFPSHFNEDPDTRGEVVFHTTDTSDGVTSYKVILESLNKPLSLTMTCDDNYTVINGNQAENSYVKNEESTHSIEYGQGLVVETAGVIDIKDQQLRQQCIMIPSQEKNTYLIFNGEDAENQAEQRMDEDQFLIDLPANDKYGSYTYELDKKPVFSTVAVRKGQQLKITCTLRDGFKYSSLLGSLVKTKSEKTEITEGMNTVKPYTYFRIEGKD